MYIIIGNKSDLCSDSEEFKAVIKKLTDSFMNKGFDLIVVSALMGDGVLDLVKNH